MVAADISSASTNNNEILALSRHTLLHIFLSSFPPRVSAGKKKRENKRRLRSSGAGESCVRGVGGGGGGGSVGDGGSDGGVPLPLAR